jgi:hypothetical protein
VARHHDGDQKSEHEQVKWIGVGLQRPVIDEYRDQQRDGSGRDPDQLANHQGVQRAMRPGVRCADDADQPDAGQREHQHEQRPVEM